MSNWSLKFILAIGHKYDTQQTVKSYEFKVWKMVWTWKSPLANINCVCYKIDDTTFN